MFFRMAMMQRREWPGARWRQPHLSVLSSARIFSPLGVSCCRTMAVSDGCCAHANVKELVLTCWTRQKGRAI